MAASGVDIVSLDWTVTIEEARRRIGNKVRVRGRTGGETSVVSIGSRHSPHNTPSLFAPIHSISCDRWGSRATSTPWSFSPPRCAEPYSTPYLGPPIQPFLNAPPPFSPYALRCRQDVIKARTEEVLRATQGQHHVMNLGMCLALALALALSPH